MALRARGGVLLGFTGTPPASRPAMQRFQLAFYRIDRAIVGLGKAHRIHWGRSLEQAAALFIPFARRGWRVLPLGEIHSPSISIHLLPCAGREAYLAETMASWRVSDLGRVVEPEVLVNEEAGKNIQGLRFNT